ncbi:MAG: hypothetical protein WBF33_11675, partial [Candidatus Nitrosopolaris sp.]
SPQRRQSPFILWTIGKTFFGWLAGRYSTTKYLGISSYSSSAINPRPLGVPKLLFLWFTNYNRST